MQLQAKHVWHGGNILSWKGRLHDARRRHRFSIPSEVRTSTFLIFFVFLSLFSFSRKSLARLRCPGVPATYFFLLFLPSASIEPQEYLLLAES